MNMSYTYGMFRQAQARVTLDRENPANSKFQFTIKTDSIDTNNAQRDTHLKGPDFFDVVSFPDITFESTTVVLDNRPQQGIVYQVTGDLTMHGVTRQITLPIQLLGEGPSLDGKPHAGFLTQTELKRSEFGMTKYPREQRRRRRHRHHRQLRRHQAVDASFPRSAWERSEQPLRGVALSRR